MLIKIRTITKQKGQGIVEYALLLAFIVGLAMMLNSGNLGGALKYTFDKMASLLAGEYIAATDWGHMNTSEFNADNQGERLAADQSSLENLATFFIGKTEAEIQALLTDGIFHTSGQEVLLGWFVSTDTGNHFFTKNLKSDGGEYTYGNGTTRPTNDQVFNWMLGDYGVNGNYQYSYDSTNNYLVSDYPIGQYNNSNMHWSNSAAWAPGTGGNGIKISLTFDKTGGDKNKSNWKVTGATVKIDSQSQNTPNGSGGLTATVKGS